MISARQRTVPQPPVSGADVEPRDSRLSQWPGSWTKDVAVGNRGKGGASEGVGLLAAMAVAIVPGGPRGGWRGAHQFVTADGLTDVVSAPIVTGLRPVSAQDVLGVAGTARPILEHEGSVSSYRNG